MWGCFFPITEIYPHAFLKLRSIHTPKLVVPTAQRFLSSLVTEITLLSRKGGVGTESYLVKKEHMFESQEFESERVSQ